MLTGFKTKISNCPFHLFLLIAILLFVFSFITWGESIDLHLHDTYFVISTIFFIWALGIAFLLVWAIYMLTSKILWKRFLTWVHVLVTIFILIALLAANFWHDKLIPPIKRDFVSFETFQSDTEREVKIFLPLVVLFLVGQLAFLINILVGLTKKLVGTR
ncbi:hypothetical protein DC498_25390 [Terrimonas sp.]|uniref:hypothetical protein n=1 Tax=Terrimonas sp. TaxID=1914338 RepID=UPI000D52257D|nr:hypothetical protein [Terrimonas sp.]PVD49374.1 hypothetical protein DC498_25390 [Terrimonas sp.]